MVKIIQDNFPFLGIKFSPCNLYIHTDNMNSLLEILKVTYVLANNLFFSILIKLGIYVKPSPKYIDNGLVNAPDKIIRSLFSHIRAGDEKLENVKEILENYNIDINMPQMFLDDDKTTFLQYSVLNCNYEITKYLLQKGAYINVIDRYGNTLLHLLADNFRIHEEPSTKLEKITKLLILNHREIKNKRGFTALNTAIYYRNSELIKILLSYNIDININSKVGKLNYSTSLELLISQYAYNGNDSNDIVSELVHLFINHHNFVLKNNMKISLLGLAHGGKCIEIYKILKTKLNLKGFVEGDYKP